jgi:pyrroline-5-carboxylate reductase
VLLIGCGRMGSALFDGWERQGLSPSVIVDPAAGDRAGHVTVGSVEDVPDGFAPAAVVVAVKPQIAGGALQGLGARFPGAVFVSIMAGRTIASMQRNSGADCWVRAMPNLPAAVGRGVTGVVASDEVDAAQSAVAERLLGAVGQVCWLADEGLLDAVTAVSGSGPAYVFLLVEALEAAGVRAGLPADVARTLARETVIGAGALLAADAGDAAAMRTAVTSKAGTTERALEVLMRAGGMADLVEAAVFAAAARSRELAT